MIKYFPFFLALLLLSSCIKVEEASLCNSAPSAPVLSNSNITAGSNSRFTASIANPGSSLTYTWVAPNPYNYYQPAIYTGSTITVPYMAGTWSVVAKNGPCASDTTKFNVNIALPSCGLSKNTFQISGSAAFNLTYVSEYIAYDYYEMTFKDGSGNTIVVYFESRPIASTEYSLTNTYVSNLNYNQCNIMYNGGYGFSSYVGTVTVNVTGSLITLGFCNATFINSANGQYVSVDGYLAEH